MIPELRFEGRAQGKANFCTQFRLDPVYMWGMVNSEAVGEEGRKAQAQHGPPREQLRTLDSILKNSKQEE